MTQHKHLKQLVRARMEKTGEAYATARRHVIAQAPNSPKSPHLPGNIATTTALRVLLQAAGARAPHNGQPFSEALLFGLAGGIGIGVFSFLYEKADFASFYLAGRHLWHDHAAYLTSAAKRLGAQTVIKESSGTKSGERQLRELLEQYRVCVAWVDASLLPHRALPTDMPGGAYHVISVYAIDDQAGAATIGDLSDNPVTIKLTDLAAARARIKKDKQRLLALEAGRQSPALETLVGEGLRACHAGLHGEGAPRQAKGNFTLDALNTWAERLVSTIDDNRWEQVFAPGHRLWRGLTSVYETIEHQGTGGGLSRPLFAEFLTEAAAATKQKALTELATRYSELGRRWSALAHAALPDQVPLFREARELYVHKAELAASDGADATDGIRAAWQHLAALEQAAKERFPISAADHTALRHTLAERVRAIHEAEVAALESLAGLISINT